MFLYGYEVKLNCKVSGGPYFHFPSPSLRLNRTRRSYLTVLLFAGTADEWE